MKLWFLDLGLRTKMQYPFVCVVVWAPTVQCTIQDLGPQAWHRVATKGYASRDIAFNMLHNSIVCQEPTCQGILGSQNSILLFASHPRFKEPCKTLFKGRALRLPEAFLRLAPRAWTKNLPLKATCDLQQTLHPQGSESTCKMPTSTLSCAVGGARVSIPGHMPSCTFEPKIQTPFIEPSSPLIRILYHTCNRLIRIEF